jgi:4-oxalomesaconate tautomerase
MWMRGGEGKALGIEHPTGVTDCVVEIDAAGAVISAGMMRTARKLFDGQIFA